MLFKKRGVFMKKYLLCLVVLMVFISCGTGGSSTVDLSDDYYTNLYDYGPDSSLLGREINMGNYLEADENEGSWTNGRLIQEAYFPDIKAQGFDTVRIPIRWSDHAQLSSPYTIDSAFMDRVKEVVDWALAADLHVVMNVHHYTEMMDQEESAQTGHIARLVSIWDQICDEFPLADYGSEDLVFELLNEPNGTIGYDDWDNIIAQLTEKIWTDNGSTQNTGSGKRKIMVGTANWGGPHGLAELDLPSACNSENTLITIHWYEPFHFTHQGAEWVDGSDAWIGTSWLGSSSEQAPLIELYDSVTSWNAAAGRGFEVFVGEFGVYTKYADAAQQKAWTAFIAREAESRGFSWAYWEHSSGFGAYDPVAGQWRTQLLDALIPLEDRP